MAKALKITGIICGICAALVLLGFVGNMRSSALCEKVVIVNRTQYKWQLVDNTNVSIAIQAVAEQVEGHPLNQIDTRAIEESVEHLPYVKSARAYKTIDKKLIVELNERRLIARLIDENGVSGFLDSEGYVLPKLKSVNLRLPVITGKYKLNSTELLNGYNAQINSVLHAVYIYARLIDESDFWKAQLQQTYLDQQGNFIAIPQVGNHEILFGSIDGMENKLRKLATFYDKGMNEARWNKYRTINLKYEDQIVCTKK